MRPYHWTLTFLIPNNNTGKKWILLSDHNFLGYIIVTSEHFCDISILKFSLNSSIWRTSRRFWHRLRWNSSPKWWSRWPQTVFCHWIFPHLIYFFLFGKWLVWSYFPWNGRKLSSQGSFTICHDCIIYMWTHFEYSEAHSLPMMSKLKIENHFLEF